jgi:hypothetical protein
MADQKISALTSATTPLAGTEVLPIVQSGATVKVANNDLRPKQIQSNATSGVLQVVGPAAASTRIATVPDANFTVARTDAAQSFTGNQTLSTGSLVIGTSGQGIDFSATPGTGTSELLSDYEQGTWEPTTTVAGATYTAQIGTYTKIGRLVSCRANLAWSAHTGSGSALVIGGLPFTNGSAATYPPIIIAGNLTMAAGTSISSYILPSNASVTILAHTDLTGADAAYNIPASANITMVISYEV